MCDKLINFEITRDDLIKADESEVDSTVEDTPVKKLKLDTTSVQQKPKLKKSEKKLQAEVKAKAAKLKAKEIFEAKDLLDVESESTAMKEQIRQQQDLIRKLQKEIDQGITSCNIYFKILLNTIATSSPSMLVTNNVVSNSSFKQNNTIHLDVS